MDEWLDLCRKSTRPVAVTGAGISVASGLPTINTTWRGIPLREMFTVESYERDVERFFACFRDVMLDWRRGRPNAAHYALAANNVPIVTQNIDGLHHHAGSREVVELHGNIRELICVQCQSIVGSRLAERVCVPRCSTCSVPLKPNIVLVGEKVRHFSRAVDLIGNADLVLVIGTRLEMAPVNQIPFIAKRAGIPVLRINENAEGLLPVLLDNKNQRLRHL